MKVLKQSGKKCKLALHLYYTYNNNKNNKIRVGIFQPSWQKPGGRSTFCQWQQYLSPLVSVFMAETGRQKYFLPVAEIPFSPSFCLHGRYREREILSASVAEIPFSPSFCLYGRNSQNCQLLSCQCQHSCFTCDAHPNWLPSPPHPTSPQPFSHFIHTNAPVHQILPLLKPVHGFKLYL